SLAHRRLARERAAERARAATWLPKLGDAVLDALAEADRVRIDGEPEALRQQRIEALTAEYLGVEWTTGLR
ncbi:MAG: hypothetical protein ABUL50_02745, partial [Rhizobacter sp.]